MKMIQRFFSWYSETFRKQKLVGKVVIGFVSLIVLFYLFSIPIAILSPSTPTPAVNNPSVASVESTLPPAPVDVATLAPTDTAVPTSTPLPTETPEPFEYLKSLVADALGTSNRDVPRLSGFSWEAESSEIAVIFTAEDNLTVDLINRGIQMDIVDILRTIQSCNTPIPYKSIVAVATFPLVDVYGNSNESNVVIATYTRENLDKVNWDNFITDNIYLIANQDSLYIHPAARP